MYIGSNIISKIYNNTNVISKIYKGSVLLYSGTTPPPVTPPTPQYYLDFKLSSGIYNTNNLGVFKHPVITNLIKENV